MIQTILQRSAAASRFNLLAILLFVPTGLLYLVGWLIGAVIGLLRLMVGSVIAGFRAGMERIYVTATK